MCAVGYMAGMEDWHVCIPVIPSPSRHAAGYFNTGTATSAPHSGHRRFPHPGSTNRPGCSSAGLRTYLPANWAVRFAPQPALA